MKYQVGDLVLVKECQYKPRLHPHLRLRLHLRSRRGPRLELDLYPHLKNTYGVITEVFNHRDAWRGKSTEDDNVYFWYSQVDAETYWFFQNDLTQYEVAK
jgi:hypothetical protein